MRDSKNTLTGKEPTLPDSSPAPQPVNPVTKQHEDHWVLSEAERKGGFIRPVRRSYVHEKCKGATSMPQAIAETYAKIPGYYGKTFCIHCKEYLPVGIDGEFVWDDGSKVGS